MTSRQTELNRHLAAAQPSATYRVIDRVAARRASGATVISLSAGEPDFDTPAHVREAGIAAIQAGMTRYTQVAGLRALREAVADKFRGENGLEVGWQDTIVCAGGKQVIYNALAATLNEGDEVVIPAPYWVSYPEIVQLCGACPVIVPCGAASGFKLTPRALEAALSAKTRWLILNSPSNPTGAVYTAEELRALADVLLAHPQVLVLSDDIYEHLIFDGARFHTLAQVEPGLQPRVLTMNGVSKAYAMTGWRIGFGTGPRWLLEAMEKLQGQQTSGASSISQHAAVAALRGPNDFIRTSQAAFQRRRDLVVGLIHAVPGLRCEKPAGAFYAFASCEGLIGGTTLNGTLLRTDEDVSNALLDELGIGVVPGSAFGLGPYLRIAYAIDDASLRAACSAIDAFARSLR
ncbi:pyridoxal phosphate-dependent aminotransferase [Ralstonia solanacearum]|uniref:pyridoxal phosphate-dependent aminotransferase n=1 Tax=Ralstonia solanacearum TaxID=305 RepID=UPI00018169CE|nr:pyridoxal phosphate-dependent aminotransferase [Ralstonia solanacearum]MDC6176632.1 pyridoxal phosphate-dependent aminotransferase [Ralstonia solanacearum]MDC6212896.1 pyridoxal phosphate-dependent aminotransferase [Ralstonia solanacearum]MDC6238137.1 pyridoxal phosphate-dependent aminotransferase [Ralstonia solanacearum]MDD7803583.1 pyridoxal phosphate-dependent aminotransferase [Ralstonia solanacearum]TYZ55759.1 pyridoxal phosphate-dependent aminotransferase [Ralstonia solanacearum]